MCRNECSFFQQCCHDLVNQFIKVLPQSTLLLVFKAKGLFGRALTDSDLGANSPMEVIHQFKVILHDSFKINFMKIRSGVRSESKEATFFQLPGQNHYTELSQNHFSQENYLVEFLLYSAKNCYKSSGKLRLKSQHVAV